MNNKFFSFLFLSMLLLYGMGGYRTFFGYGVVLFYLLSIIFTFYFVLNLLSRNLPLDILKYSFAFLWFPVVLFSAFNSPVPQKHFIDIFLTFCIWTSCFYLAYICILNEYSELLSKLILLWVLIQLFIYILFITSIFKMNAFSFSGVYESRNVLAVTASFLLAFYINAGYKMHSNVLFFIISASLVFLVLITASTKGIISVALILFIWLIPLLSKMKGVLIVLIISLFVFSAGYIGLFDESIVRLLVKLDVSDIYIESFGLDPKVALYAESSQEHRVQLSIKAFDLILQNPMIGYGMRGSESFLALNGNEGTYTHNNYMELLFSGGFLGVIFYYVPLAFLTFKVISGFFYFTLKNNQFRICITFLLLILFNQIALVSYKSFIFVFFYFYIMILNPSVNKNESLEEKVC